MKKLIITILILIGSAAHANAATTCGRSSATSGSYVTTGCTGGNVTYNWSVGGYYNTQAEAQTAATTAASSLGSAHNTSAYGTVSGQMWGVSGFGNTYNTNTWGIITAYAHNCNLNGAWEIFYFYVKTSWIDLDNNCVADSGQDTDNDGIPDESDPYEDDPECFKFNVIYRAFCDGAIVGIHIVTNKGDEFEYGYDRQEEGDCTGVFTTRMYVDINAGGGDSYAHDCNDLAGLLSGSTGGDNSVNDADTTDEIDYNADGSVKTEIPDKETGTSATSSNTETENTAATANNTEKILDAINKGNEISLGTQKLTDEVLKKTESLQSTIEKGNDHIGEHLDSLTSTGTVGDFGSLNKDLYKQDGSFTEGDEYNTALDNKIKEVSPDGTIGSVVNNAMNNSVITNFKNSHIQITSPSSVFSFDFSALGHTQTFSFDLSRWAGILSTAGNVFYTITLVLGFVVVLRGH
jgi:hypothetical protein